MPAKAIPEGYHSITPYLAVDDASGAIEFYKKAFGAKENRAHADARRQGGARRARDRRLADHALGSVRPGADQDAEGDRRDDRRASSSTSEDVDETYKQALDAGATSTSEPEDMFWGDRFASVTDPYGHSWQIATHVEDIEPEEMERRSREAMASTPA